MSALMAANTREIKGRMKAVGNIQRITKTMQMIATARFQAMQRRATEARAFTRKITEVVGELATALGGESSVSHPLAEAPAIRTGRQLVLVITSNRGLCGGYNANVLRTAGAFIKNELGIANADIEVVGKKGIGYCKFNHIPLSRSRDFGDTPAYEEIDHLAQEYMDRFTAGQYDAVQVIYMSFVTMARQQPVVRQLLPLTPPAAENKAAGDKVTGTVTYDFMPEPAELLAELLPLSVKTTLFQCFNEAVVSEQLARMVAMKAATDAAGKQRKLLKRQFNRARQTAITTELSEIISGAAALE